MSNLKSLIKKLGIDETNTTPPPKAKQFTHVKDNVYPDDDYNYAVDLLFLPQTSEGFRYLLVAVDLWSDEFDIEPLKSKEPEEVLNAFRKMFKRKYIKKPKGSVRTDSGNEFKGEFKDYLFNESILKKESVKGRHTQMGSVESLNRILGKLFNGLMNMKEEKTGERFVEWTDFVSLVRKELNDYRKERRKKQKINQLEIDKIAKGIDKDSKFKVGDVVFYALDVPRDALNNEQSTQKFREGDYRWAKAPKKIINVFFYGDPIAYRYELEGIKNVSYTDKQLRPSKEKETKYDVKSIIGERQRNKKKEYLVWWKGYLVKDATWEPEQKLEEDFGKDHLKALLDVFKESKKKSPKKDKPKQTTKVKTIELIPEPEDKPAGARRSARLANKK